MDEKERKAAYWAKKEARGAKAAEKKTEGYKIAQLLKLSNLR